MALSERIACMISPGEITTSLVSPFPEEGLQIRGRTTPTGKLGRVRLKVIPLIATVALHDDLEQRRRLL